MNNKKGTTRNPDSDFENLKAWQENPNLDYYLSDNHWNFNVNRLLYNILLSFYNSVYDGPAEVGIYLDDKRDSFFEPIKDYSWQYGRMFNEAYRLCSFVITTPVPETKISQVANEASSLFFRDMKLPKGCRPPIPKAIDMILSYHILGMVNAILMWANDRTDSVDRFIDALYHYNDTGVIYRKGMLFEIRNHDFQFYHAVYLAQIVKQMIDASELRSRYDYGCRDGYLRKKFAWYKADADNYERMIKERRNKNSSESIPDRLPLPEALNRNDAQKYFKRAIEKGYMKYEGGKYEWLGVPNVKGPKSQLAYFCGKVYGYEWGIVDGNPKNIVYGNIGTEIPEGELIALFGVNKLCQLLHQVYSAGKIQGWRNNIDALFE